MHKNIFDGIIVLSNLMDSNGKLNSESCLRADKAVETYKLNPQAIVITCGWNYRDDCDIKIADSMSEYLNNKHKISRDNLIKEYKSRDTVGDAIFTRRDIVTKYDLKSLAIVTSIYHAKRTQEIFNFVYGNSFKISVFSCNVPFNKKDLKSEKDSLNKFRETFSGIEKGNIDQIYLRLIEKHPFYNGEIFYFNDN